MSTPPVSTHLPSFSQIQPHPWPSHRAFPDSDSHHLLSGLLLHQPPNWSNSNLDSFQSTLNTVLKKLFLNVQHIHFKEDKLANPAYACFATLLPFLSCPFNSLFIPL